MKAWINRIMLIAGIALIAFGWLVYFHNADIAAKLPKWGWLQKSVVHLGEKIETPAPEDEDPDNTKNEIPVHAAHITTATLHRYVQGFGVIAPRPALPDQMAGGATLASPVNGVVAKVLVRIGQPVHANDALVQLDDRVAKAVEDQAVAALAQAEASQAALKATPRPDQLQIAEIGVEKSKSAMEFAQSAYNRVKELAAEQGASSKALQQASADLASAKADLQISLKQLALLKSTPTAEDLAQEAAKVAQAKAALVVAKMQHDVLTLRSPIDATVVSLSINPGESVDPTKPLVQLISIDRLIVDVDVGSDELPEKPIGLAAQIIAAGASVDSSNPIVGKVTFVGPQVDPKTGAVQTGIDLPADAKLRPGQTVSVQIIAEEHKDILAVPREALVTDENGDSVIALIEGTQATHKAVKAGLAENGLIEITADGIKDGDTVATAGAYGLPQASRVKVVD